MSDLTSWHLIMLDVTSLNRTLNNFLLLYFVILQLLVMRCTSEQLLCFRLSLNLDSPITSIIIMFRKYHRYQLSEHF